MVLVVYLCPRLQEFSSFQNILKLLKNKCVSPIFMSQTHTLIFSHILLNQLSPFGSKHVCVF